jgi:hypothetical protein
MTRLLSVISIYLPVLLGMQILPVSGQIVINEFMAFNTSFNLDPDFQSNSDWLELYNNSDLIIDLSGYYITDNLTNPQKWTIPPGTEINPYGFIVFWADGRNTGSHTSFKLEGLGEQIGIYDSLGNVIDSVTYPGQYSDISSGRIAGDTSWFFFQTPTPGNSNIYPGFQGISSEPVFSLEGGFYSQSVQVGISGNEPDTEIRYTLNGSEPDSTSLKYIDPINLDKTTIIRAKIHEKDKLPGKIITQTYFINEPDHDLPVLSISTDPENLWDPDSGIYVNYDEDWERPCGFEYFDSSGSQQFNINAGIKIFGGTSRARPQKSFSIYARERYGDGEIHYRLLPGRDNEIYKSFLLRNGANDWSGDWRGTMFRDALIHTIPENMMDLDYQSYQPAVIYLNGEYWGILNIRDKHNEDYCEVLYGVDRDSVDIIKHNEVVAGDSVLYIEMMNFLENNDLYSEEKYHEASAMIDIEEFINYMIVEIYSCNIDWPANNHRLWRSRIGDGKWRWMLFDTEFGFNGFQWAPVTTNMFTKALDPDIEDYVNKGQKAPWATRVFIKLTQNEEFVNRFVSAYLSHVYTTYYPERVVRIIDSLRNNLVSEMPRHIEKWGNEGGIYSMSVWEQNVQGMRDFAYDRPQYAIRHLKQTFGLADSDKLTLTLKSDEGGCILLNNIPLERNPFIAEFYKDLPVKLNIMTDPDFKFIKWQINDSTIDYSRQMDVILGGDITITAVIEKTDIISDLRINEFLPGNSGSIRDNYGERDDWIELYNASQESVDIGGLYITDELANPGLWKIPESHPDSTTIQAGDFLILWADDQPEQGILHIGLKINKDGEELGLFQEFEEEMILLDSVSFPSLVSDHSFARYPDATGDWIIFDTPTPGEYNFYLGAEILREKFTSFEIYPNPFSEEIHLNMISGYQGMIQVRIYNLSGQDVYSATFRKEEGNIHKTIQLENCTSGIYILNIMTDTECISRKIVKN